MTANVADLSIFDDFLSSEDIDLSLIGDDVFQLKIKISGEGYHASIPGDLARNIWSLQESLYRAAAEILHGEPNWCGSIGPGLLGAMTGSGDASTFAFNEAVTPHAVEFGMELPKLGALAFLIGTLGWTSSPIACAMVVVSGLAMVSPIEVAKRTSVPCFCAEIVPALIMV